MKYNSSRELAHKVDSEGGLAGILYGYGLNSDELPDNMPEGIRYKLDELLNMQETYDEVQSWLYERMEDDPVPGDYDYEEPDGA